MTLAITESLCEFAINCKLNESHSFRDKKTPDHIKSGLIKVRICDQFNKALESVVDLLDEIAGHEEMQTKKIMQFISIVKSSSYTKAEDFILFFEDFNYIVQQVVKVAARIELDMSNFSKITRKIYESRIKPFNDLIEAINDFMVSLTETVANIIREMDVKTCESFTLVSNFIVTTFGGKKLDTVVFNGSISEDNDPRNNISKHFG